MKSQVLSSLFTSSCKCCLCSVELRIYVIKMHRAKTIRKSSQISGNLPCFLKSSILSRSFPFYSGTFQTVWKFSRLSRNIEGCVKIFQTVRKFSRLSRNLSDCPKHFSDCPEIFHTFQKFSRLSRYLLDCPELFKAVWSSSTLS